MGKSTSVCLWVVGITATWICVVEGSRMDYLTWDDPRTRHSTERIIRAADDETIRDCSDPNNIYLPPTVTETTERLGALRQQMKLKGYDAYIVPSEDEHLSEYVAPRDQRRKWITGFSGSAGIAVVTDTEAALWTDGRYYLQSEREMDCNWKLMKSDQSATPSISEWIVFSLSNGSTVGANPFVFSISRWASYQDAFIADGIDFKVSIPDLIDSLWTDRPGPLGTEIIVFPLEYAGKHWTEKISDVRVKMADEGADYLLLTKLDEIAWLFNLRGNDIPYTPVFTSYALVGMASARIYINMSFVTDELTELLSFTGCSSEDMCVDLREYSTAYHDVLNMPAGTMVWMSTASTTYGMYSVVDPENQIQDESPIKIPKSIKNEVEVEGMKQAQIYDAVALCEYMIWLEENVPKGIVDEFSGAAKLESLRWAQTASKGPSFSAISSSGPNGALNHYEPTNETKRLLTIEEVYLLDSGGHYFEGTTDTTRTILLGTPTDFQKEAFTRVLMGVIDVETAIFTSNLDGTDIDILARRHLFDAGLNYRHGTGHGVGQYLTIHEYPPGIGTSGVEGYPFQVGMFTSVEPGYYQDGEFGIRHENMVVVVEADTKYHFGEHAYLTFEAVTLVPFQQNMIDIALLSDKQLEYLNAYHARILKTVGDEALKQEKREVHDWLQTATKAMARNAGYKLHAKLSLALFPVLLSFGNCKL